MIKQNIIFAEERSQDIIAQLNKKGKVTVSELAERYSVSLPTIRADLAQLEAQGFLQRTHGGAIPIDTRARFELTSAEKETRNVGQKKAIAKEAIKLVKEGDVITLDTGTTTREIAKLLVKRDNLTVITNDIKIAGILEENKTIAVTLIGGTVRSGFHCSTGPISKEVIKSLYSDIAFIAANAISLKRGLSTPDEGTSEIKYYMRSNTDKVVVVADSSKAENEALYKFADLADIDILIMDSGIPAEFAAALKEEGVKLIKAK